MNFASDGQLTAVGQSCRDFKPINQRYVTSTMSTAAEDISCEVCQHWDGERCRINVFDKVLTSLDQE